jgi:hypothetical protein
LKQLEKKIKKKNKLIMSDTSVESLVAYSVHDDTSITNYNQFQNIRESESQKSQNLKKPVQKYYRFFIELEQPEAERASVDRIQILVDKLDDIKLNDSKEIMSNLSMKNTKINDINCPNINNNANESPSTIKSQGHSLHSLTQTVNLSQSEYDQQVFFDTKIRVKIYQNKKGEILVKSAQPETNQSNNNNNNNKTTRSLNKTQASSSSTLSSSREISSRKIGYSISKSNRSSIKLDLRQLNSKDNQIESKKDKLIVKNKNLPFDLNISFVDLALKNDNL